MMKETPLLPGSGVRCDHEDLQDALVTEKCVTYNKGRKIGFRDGDFSDDDQGHGTSVTGIIAASINNNIGVCGVAGGRSKVFVVDARDIDGGISTIDLALGIYYETDQGARLINMSLGSYCKDMVLQRAVKYAWDNDVLVICSAGNKSTSFMHYPGDAPYAMSVMSHDWDGSPSSFTGYGIDKDVSAPGEALATTSNLRKKSYKSFNGTSAACPMVTGAAALLLSADPGLTPREIKNLLYTSSGKESFSVEKAGQGFGRINLDTAMKNLRSAKTVPEKIVINKKNIEIYEGQETYIEYAVYPGNTNSVNATFGSSNNHVVTVDKDGVVKAKAPGSAVITVSCKGAVSVCTVTVKEIPCMSIDRKPYAGKGTFTMDGMLETFIETNHDGDLRYENGYFYHLYQIGLEKGETIQAVMSGESADSVICIKDKNGNIVAKDDFNKSTSQSAVAFTADRADTYQLLAIRNTGSGVMTDVEYDLQIVSDKAFCNPKVSSTDYGQMRMTWPAVRDADCYRVCKYSDKELTKKENEWLVKETRFVDTEYDSGKDQYYTVTACLQSMDGLFFCAESPLVVRKSTQTSDQNNSAGMDTPGSDQNNTGKNTQDSDQSNTGKNTQDSDQNSGTGKNSPDSDQNNTGKNTQDSGQNSSTGMDTQPGNQNNSIGMDTQTGTEGIVIKMNNPLRVKGRKIKVKAKKLKKTKVILKRSKVLKVRKAIGKVTYIKLKGNKKITISKRTGRVRIKKKLRKGTYRVKVMVMAAGNSSYKAAVRKATFIIKVR